MNVQNGKIILTPEEWNFLQAELAREPEAIESLKWLLADPSVLDA